MARRPVASVDQLPGAVDVCPRGSGSSVSLPGSICLSPDRQHDRLGVHQQQRGACGSPQRPGASLSGLVPLSQHLDPRSIPAGSHERVRGSSLSPAPHGSLGVDAGPSGLPSAGPPLRSSQRGPVRTAVGRSGSPVLQLAPDAGVCSSGRPAAGLGSRVGTPVRVSSILPPWSRVAEAVGHRASDFDAVAASFLADPAVVAGDASPVDRRAGGAARLRVSPVRSPGPAPASAVADPVRASLVQLLGRLGLPSDVARLALQSWTRGTQRRHLTWLQRFLDYLRGAGVAFSAVAPTHLASFLTSDYASRQRRSQLDQARASIATMVRLVLDREISKNTVVAAVARGAHREQPGAPRYHEYYDTDRLRTHLRSWGPSASLSLQRLRDKTLLLVRLASIRRGADLAAVDVRTMRVFDNRVEFRALLTKELALSRTSRESWSDPIVLLRDPDSEQCPVATLLLYLQRTERFRISHPRSLFLAVRPPYGPLTSQRLNSITTALLAEAGLPREFTAASTRMAEASTRVAGGEHIFRVVKRGGWRTDRVFTRHYLNVFAVGPSVPVQPSAHAERRE
jgi:hypothetical protein